MRYYLVHHKIFDLEEFYKRSKNFTEPGHFELKTAFDCGQYSGFSIYTESCGDCSINDLKIFLDSKYGSAAYNVIYEIYPDTSGGWMSFQTIEDLKNKANNY